MFCSPITGARTRPYAIRQSKSEIKKAFSDTCHSETEKKSTSKCSASAGFESPERTKIPGTHTEKQNIVIGSLGWQDFNKKWYKRRLMAVTHS